jgi:hypothetical protein
MDEDVRADVQLTLLKLTATQHVIQLAKVVAAFDALIEGGRMLEEGLDVPRQEVPGVPDVDELFEEEADMPLGQAARTLANFFDMDVEGQARLMLILGLEEL